MEGNLAGGKSVVRGQWSITARTDTLTIAYRFLQGLRSRKPKVNKPDMSRTPDLPIDQPLPASDVGLASLFASRCAICAKVGPKPTRSATISIAGVAAPS